MSEKTEAVRAATPETASDTNLQPKFSPKSVRVQAQRERILAALRKRPHTTQELRKGPVASFQCPTRIFELRQAGYRIDTTLVTVTDEDSFSHPRTALYTLLAEPDSTRQLALWEVA